MAARKRTKRVLEGIPDPTMIPIISYLVINCSPTKHDDNFEGPDTGLPLLSLIKWMESSGGRYKIHYLGKSSSAMIVYIIVAGLHSRYKRDKLQDTDNEGRRHVTSPPSGGLIY